MRQGVKPGKTRVEGKPTTRKSLTSRRSLTSDGSRVHDLENRLAEALKRRLRR
jgi:hypothetical protein